VRFLHYCVSIWQVGYDRNVNVFCMIVIVCGVFLGDRVGWKESLWVPFVAVAIPIMFILYQKYKQQINELIPFPGAAVVSTMRTTTSKGWAKKGFGNKMVGVYKHEGDDIDDAERASEMTTNVSNPITTAVVQQQKTQ
jgi:hypothetical protein